VNLAKRRLASRFNPGFENIQKITPENLISVRIMSFRSFLDSIKDTARLIDPELRVA
jgi:hypothetical protein